MDLALECRPDCRVRRIPLTKCAFDEVLPARDAILLRALSKLPQ